jgi:hypothetical protein
MTEKGREHIKRKKEKTEKKTTTEKLGKCNDQCIRHPDYSASCHPKHLASLEQEQDHQETQKPSQKRKLSKKVPAGRSTGINPDWEDSIHDWSSTPAEIPIVELDLNIWPDQKGQILREISRMKMNIKTLQKIIKNMDREYERPDETDGSA